MEPAVVVESIPRTCSGRRSFIMASRKLSWRGTTAAASSATCLSPRWASALLLNGPSFGRSSLPPTAVGDLATENWRGVEAFVVPPEALLVTRPPRRKAVSLMLLRETALAKCIVFEAKQGLPKCLDRECPVGSWQQQSAPHPSA